MISSMLLNSNEFVGLGTLEITSVPDISILAVDQSVYAEQAILDYKRDMANLLKEIYQQYKALNTVTGMNNDLSLECLWVTQRVGNQPYKDEKITR